MTQGVTRTCVRIARHTDSARKHELYRLYRPNLTLITVSFMDKQSAVMYVHSNPVGQKVDLRRDPWQGAGEAL